MNMDALIPVVVTIIGLVVMGPAALLWGCDSRDLADHRA